MSNVYTWSLQILSYIYKVILNKINKICLSWVHALLGCENKCFLCFLAVLSQSRKLRCRRAQVCNLAASAVLLPMLVRQPADMVQRHMMRQWRWWRGLQKLLACVLDHVVHRHLLLGAPWKGGEPSLRSYVNFRRMLLASKRNLEEWGLDSYNTASWRRDGSMCEHGSEQSCARLLQCAHGSLFRVISRFSPAIHCLVPNRRDQDRVSKTKSVVAW